MKRHLVFVQIKKHSKTESLLRSNGFSTAGAAEGSPEFVPAPTLIWNAKLFGCNCRKLRTASYRSVCSSYLFRNTPPAHGNPAVSFTNLESYECKAGLNWTSL